MATTAMAVGRLLTGEGDPTPSECPCVLDPSSPSGSPSPSSTCASSSTSSSSSSSSSSLSMDELQQLDREHRSLIIRAFCFIFLAGPLAMTMGAWYTSPTGVTYSPFETCLAVCFCSALAVAAFSFRAKLRHQDQGGDMWPLVAFCVVLDVLLTVEVLAECNPRDVFLWFVTIPLLLLYGRGAGSCLAGAVFVSAQTTLLRYAKDGWLGPHLDCSRTFSEFRSSPLGASLSDSFLIALLALFSASNYYARSRAMVTLRKALEACERANVKLQQATKAKSDFLANVTHELRTPMHGIIAMSRELQDLLPPKTKAAEAVTIISNCADHLLSLVNDILDFEQIESNQLELEKLSFSVAKETTKVIDMLRFSADAKRLKLTYEIDVPQPQRIGDPVRFRQILFNLLTNAIKFTPEEGSVSVSLASSPEKAEELELVVSDTGIGISQEHIPNLFSSFSQVDASVRRKYGGSGLGLAISKRLCNSMNGTISCTSELGKGSTFRVKIGLPPSKEADAMLPETEAEETVPDSPHKGFEGLKVLLAEDNAVNQKVGKRMLDSLGCHVEIVQNGVECVQRAKQEPFDLILMDCQMPVMDGFQATQRIREMEKSREESDAPSPALPIIALTASATKEYGLKCLEVGMSDVLYKPLRRETLCAALRKWAPPRPQPEEELASSTRRQTLASLSSSDQASGPSFPVLYRQPESLTTSSSIEVRKPFKEVRRSRSMPSSTASVRRSELFLAKLREDVEAAHRKIVFGRKEST